MVGRYQTQRRIAAGGIGAVYEALDTQLNRRVAVKRLLSQEESHDPTGLSQDLRQEATALSALQHPNILTVFDIGSDDEGFFVVTELIDGETLDVTVERGAFPVDDFLSFAEQSLEGIIAAHDQGLLHRDLKPSNIMIKWLPSGRYQVKILDFGLAKFSETPSVQTSDQAKAILGTVAFMAPEQFERKPLDARTDLYALGCMFYFILTGRRPFRGASAAKTMNAHLDHDVVELSELRPDLPKVLTDWVMWHLNVDPDDRPITAKYGLDILRLAVAGQAVMDLAPSTIDELDPKGAQKGFYPEGYSSGDSGELSKQLPSGRTTKLIPLITQSAEKLLNLSRALGTGFQKQYQNLIPRNQDEGANLPSWLSKPSKSLSGAGANLRYVMDRWQSDDFRFQVGRVSRAVKRQNRFKNLLSFDKIRESRAAQKVRDAARQAGESLTKEYRFGDLPAVAKARQAAANKAKEVAKGVSDSLNKEYDVGHLVGIKNEPENPESFRGKVAKKVGETLNKSYKLSEVVPVIPVQQVMPKKLVKRVRDKVDETLGQKFQLPGIGSDSSAQGDPPRELPEEA